MAKAKLIKSAVDALGNKIGALGDYLKEFDPRTFYHYSPDPNIKKFEKKTNTPFGGSGGVAPHLYKGRGATYFTSDPKYANKIMEYIHQLEEGKNFSDYDWEEIIKNQHSPTIYPVKIKTKDIFDFENPEHFERLDDDPLPELLNMSDMLEGGYQTYENKEFQEILKEAGFRGYKTNEPGTVALFYPDEGDVRSVFAKFDPSKSKKGEILAAVPAGALGALGAIDGESSN